MRKTIKTTIFPCFSENSCAVRMRHSPLYLPNVKSDSLVRNAQSKTQCFPISPSISLYLPKEKNNQNHQFSHVPPFFITFSENHCTVRMCHSPLYLPNVKSDFLVRNVQSKPQFFLISPSISLYLPNEKKQSKPPFLPCFSENHCTVRVCHSPLYLPNVKSDSLVRNVKSKPPFLPVSP